MAGDRKWGDDFNSCGRANRKERRAIYLLEKVLEGPASRPSPVLSRIQFGHCPQFHLQRGITIVYSPGARPRRRVQARSPASTINLISNALSASVSFLPRLFPAPAPPRPATPRRPLQPLDEQEFSILSSTAGERIARGCRRARRSQTKSHVDRKPSSAGIPPSGEIAWYVTAVMSPGPSHQPGATCN